MKEHSKVRLSQITARYARRQGAVAEAEAAAAAEARFLSEFVRVRAEVLRPILEEVVAQLAEAGHRCRIEEGSSEGAPHIELHVLLEGRAGLKNVIRFVVRQSEGRGTEVIAEIELRRSPVELARYQGLEALTREVVEQLLVDAVEQLFIANEVP